MSRKLVIYAHMPYYISKDLGYGIELVPLTPTAHDEILYVGCDDPELTLNPTNTQLAAMESK